jgi:hypothetical protein
MGVRIERVKRESGDMNERPAPEPPRRAMDNLDGWTENRRR